MVTNRKNLKFRAWITDKIQTIKSENELNIVQNEQDFIDNYIENWNPSNSTQKVQSMKDKKTLLGPGYYDVKH